MRTRVISCTVLGTLGVVASGCGSDDSYKNEPRPPAPIVLTASISKDRISVSPATFGAGPVSLIITNQTGAPQTVTLKGVDLTQSTGSPINPADTATIKADVKSGAASVSVDGGAINEATLKVGPSRPSAQDQLLLP